MHKRLRTPPIQYLSAFEAAARHCSFKAAAKELNVTPSAISQQIKSLERLLGVMLFERKPREIVLSSAGYSFYRVAERTIATYESGFSQFNERYFSSTLRISMIPYLANEIIIGRLQQFSEKHPDINLVIETSMQVENLASSELDGAIRFGKPPWQGNNVQFISGVKTNLVATESYFDKHPLKDADDFKNQNLIHTRTGTNDWQRLRTLFNIETQPAKELFFDSYSASIKAAEEGLGVALGLFPITNRALKEGRLVALMPNHYPIEEAYYLVTKPNDAKQDNYEKLHSWLVDVFAGL